jgi:glycosyltransferase involved in cell wall biosynthesis
MVIVSSVLHFKHTGRLYARGAYAREIDAWADLFSQIEIAAPCRNAAPSSDCVAFQRDNIRMLPQLETGGRTWTAKLHQIFLLPILLVRLASALRRGDAIQVRCPGNLGLLAALLAPLFCRYRVAKYAGQWNGFPGERPMVRLQRMILRSRWWAAPVIVYGQWPHQPRHIHPLFNCVMTSDQIQQANQWAIQKEILPPLRILYCGRLVPDKRVGLLLESAAQLSQRGIAWQLTIVGDGPERPALEQLAADLSCSDRVRFVGAIPFEQVFAWYRWADCLALLSVSEGWPKVIAEAMCFGVVCIGASRGLVPEMLAGRGIVLETLEPHEVAKALARVARFPDQMTSLRHRALEWSRQFSLDELRQALDDLLSREWKLESSGVRSESVGNVEISECQP